MYKPGKPGWPILVYFEKNKRMREKKKQPKIQINTNMEKAKWNIRFLNLIESSTEADDTCVQPLCPGCPAAPPSPGRPDNALNQFILNKIEKSLWFKFWIYLANLFNKPTNKQNVELISSKTYFLLNISHSYELWLIPTGWSCYTRWTRRTRRASDSRISLLRLNVLHLFGIISHCILWWWSFLWIYIGIGQTTCIIC